jgi:ATP-dependent DNA helicase RecG
MVIENAERFGLSQLHQLRGRVGRGKHQSYCMLVSDSAEGSAAKERLGVMKNSTNGYEIAEYDLKQRGPGDFLSDLSGQTRQHGQVGFRLAGLCDDISLLAKATAAATATLEADPEIKSEGNLVSREYMERLFILKDNTVN